MTIQKRKQNRNLISLLDTKFKFNFTDRQTEIIKTISNPETQAILIDGPAGTAKTFLAVYCGLKELAKKSKDNLLYIRTAAESGKIKLGARPGEIDEKISHLIIPLRDKMDEIMPEAMVNELLMSGDKIEAMPVNDIRGSNWIDRFVIFDEAQNAELSELITASTRLSFNSKIIFTGDSMQCDIRNSGWSQFLDRLDAESAKKRNIHVIRLGVEDIKRNEFVKFIVETFRNI